MPTKYELADFDGPYFEPPQVTDADICAILDRVETERVAASVPPSPDRPLPKGWVTQDEARKLLGLRSETETVLDSQIISGQSPAQE